MRHLHKGFTLVEMLIVVGILGIVLTMAVPDFIGFFQIQRDRSEERMMDEIRRALELYADDTNTLPPEATWFTDIAPYTSLSPAQIQTDIYGNPRLYVMRDTVTNANDALSPVNFRDTELQVYYAMVLSFGEDGCWDDAVPVHGLAGEVCPPDGDAMPGTFFEARLNANTTNNNSYESYERLELSNSTVDDHLIKFTDYELKVRKYMDTLARIEAISDALNDYSARKYNEAVDAGEASVDDLLFFPPSDTAGLDDPDVADGDPQYLYSTEITGAGNDMENFFGAGVRIINDTADANHEDHMRRLMRMLGLPDSYCCSALNDLPFIYVSNPRERNAAAGDCHTVVSHPDADPRPDRGDRFLPPVVAAQGGVNPICR